MATVVKTFTFDSDAESFSPSDASLTWTGGAGSPSAGCLQNVATGRRSGLPQEWTRTLTWEALGVPAGATVTSITASGMYHRCSTWVVGDTVSTQALKLVVGGTEYGLVDCGTYSGTTSWAQATGGSVDIPDQASDASVTVMIDQYARTGNNGSAAVTVQADTATFTVEYTALAVPVVNVTAGPTPAKISAMSGYDTAAVTFTVDVSADAWELRMVDAGTAVRDTGDPLILSGGTVATGGSVDVTYGDIAGAVSGDGAYTLKFYAQNTSGWSG